MVNQLTHKFTLYYTNCDVLTKTKVNELEVYSQLYSPDIICLTEVLPKNSIIVYCDDMYFLRGYVLVSSSLSLKARGICIFAKSELKVVTLDAISIFREYVFCKFIFNEEVLFLGVVYRSPNSTYDNNVQLCNLLNYMCELNSDNLIIIGDFNYPNIDWNVKRVCINSPCEDLFLEKIQDLFLEQLVTQPTRVREGQRRNILDLVFTNNEYFIENVDYQNPIGASDHISIVLQLNLNKPQEIKEVPRKLYYKGDYLSMSRYFLDIDWTELFSNLNTQQCLDVFYNHFNLAVDKFIPISVKSKIIQTDKLWVNFDVRSASKIKRQAWNSVYKDKVNNLELIQEWKRLRNASNTISDKARSNYENKIIQDSKSNPKSFWSYVKKRSKKPGDVSSLVNLNGTLIVDDQENANLLNNYFLSVFVEEPNDNFFDTNVYHHVDITIENFVIEKEAIVKAISKLSTSKASGPDEIHSRIIKECCIPFSDIFYLFYTKSLQEGVLPNQWKQANVKALFKKGSRTQCSNYRPVSLTSIICKIFESLIRDKLVVFLDDNSILCRQQHGFRSGHSCATQLLEIMEDFTTYYDMSIPYDCIYLDFAKAFDRVPHNRLLTKVYNCGICGNIFSWIKRFLSDNLQQCPKF